jgi:hypothetical protein
MDTLLRQWNETYFDSQLSPAVLNIFDALALSTQSEAVKGILERQFKMMKRTHFQATDFTDDLARNLYGVLNIFTKTWNGTPPPITLAGRHIKMDTYVTCNHWWQFPRSGAFLDLGCGFPPLTAIETAQILPDWRVIGADPVIPHFIVYDERGDYANLNEAGDVLYFQGQDERFGAFTQDPAGTKAYFGQLFRLLMDKQKEIGVDEVKSIEFNGVRLVTIPIGAYETPNLSFQTAGIGAVDIQGVDVVRCFNVLVYFDRPFRNKALAWFAEIVRDGGLVLCGENSHRSISSRYTILQREQGRLIEKEFAIGIDTLRVPADVMPWWAFHNDEVEMNRQAILVAQIRADTTFRRDFDSRFDALLAEQRLFKRGTDGYLTTWEAEMPADKIERLAQINEQLDQEGYVDGAVNVLRQAGYQAWRNCVGHICVDPAQLEV